VIPSLQSEDLKPAASEERIVAVDVVRGLAVLGILVVNMWSFAGQASVPPYDLTPVNRLATLLVRFLAQAKFYPLFSFLFGWGMAVQMRRAAARGRGFPLFYLRRLAVLLGFGLLHTILVWEGDILVNYALLGLPLLLVRKRSDKTILILAVACILIPVLMSVPGPGSAVRAWQASVVDHLRRGILAGHQGGPPWDGGYVNSVRQRAISSWLSTVDVLKWAPHILGMFLLGLYAGRRRMLTEKSDHVRLLRRVLWGTFGLGVVFNVIFVVASGRPTLFPPPYRELTSRGARTVAGSALSIAYVAGVAQLTRKDRWLARLAPLASVGRTALSNYLLQSSVCTLVFYDYGLGLYGALGPAVLLLLSLFLFRLQVAASRWWLERYRFGPAEWLWRSLAYGKPQPWRAESSPHPTISSSRGRRRAAPDVFFDALALMGRKLVFIGAVSFAIVAFCTIGLELSQNSRLPLGRERLTVWEVAGPALEDSVDFFEGLASGDLGRIPSEIPGQQSRPVTGILAEAFAESARLLALAVGSAAALGVAVGAFAAIRRHSILALPTLTLTVIGVSVPSFLLALLLQVGSIVFYKRTGVRLVLFGPDLGGAKSLLPRIVLPAAVLAARPLAHVTRVTFIALSDVLEQDYVRTARAKGLREILVFWHHVLRNAGVRILTAAALSLRFALGSLPIAEIFFDQPGLGVVMLHGIFRREARLVAGAALGLGVTLLLINMTLDLIYRVIDPTLREAGNGGSS